MRPSDTAVGGNCQPPPLKNWPKAEFGWSERTAKHFMSVAQRFGAKSAIVADLTLQPTSATSPSVGGGTPAPASAADGTPPSRPDRAGDKRLLGFYAPTEGQLLIDGVDLRNYAPEAVAVTAVAIADQVTQCPVKGERFARSPRKSLPSTRKGSVTRHAAKSTIEKLAAELLKVLQRYRGRWDPRKLTDLAR